MEAWTLFTYLQDNSYSPVELASNFLDENFSEEEMNEELTVLLLNSCGIVNRIPADLVANEVYDEIFNFFEQQLSRVNQKSIPLRNLEYYDRFILFFEALFSLKWNVFTNDGNFNSYLPKLTNALTMSGFPFLQVTCFIIKLKFITSYLKNPGDGELIDDVRNYAENIFVKSACRFHTFQCLFSALREFSEWIKYDDEFIADEYLRLIVWSLKIGNPVVVCLALNISCFLLSKEKYRSRLQLFVSKLTEKLEDLCFTSNKNIFRSICQCCTVILVNYGEALKKSLIDNLLDNLFAEDRDRAIMTAEFWLKSMFIQKSSLQRAKILIKFLSGKKPIHTEILVDSLKDIYASITDWKLYLVMLTNRDQEGLTRQEKEQLLLIMTHAVEQAIAGPPVFRGKGQKSPNFEESNKVAEKLTRIMIPFLDNLFKTEFPRKCYAKTMLLHLTSYLSFNTTNKETLLRLIQESHSLIENCNHASAYEAAFQMLSLLKEWATDEHIVNESKRILSENEKFLQNNFMNLIYDFIQDPDKYKDSPNKEIRTKTVRILSHVYVLSTKQRWIEKKFAYIIPGKILEHEFLPENPVYLFILHICVILMCNYVVYCLEKMKSSDYSLTREEVDNIWEIFMITIEELYPRLREWYHSELSLVVFFGLCNILMAVPMLEIEKEFWGQICPQQMQKLITGYVNSIVWKGKEKYNTARNVHTKTRVLEAHLNLIMKERLPLTHAYDIMRNICNERAVIEQPLRNFISYVNHHRNVDEIITWIMNWLQTLYNLSIKDCIEELKEFIRVIYPIRKQLQEVFYGVQLKGIDYSVTPLAQNPRHEFLLVLGEMCVCLDKDRKFAVYKYFMKNRTDMNEKILSFYTKCLKKQTKFDSGHIVTSTPNVTFSSVEKSSPCYPGDDQVEFSSSEGYSPIIANESDSESEDDHAASIFLVNSNSDNSMTLADLLEHKYRQIQTNSGDEIDEMLKNFDHCTLSSSSTSRLGVSDEMLPRKRRRLSNK